jgi:uncharacterized RmlC-like cupin family protein
MLLAELERALVRPSVAILCGTSRSRLGCLLGRGPQKIPKVGSRLAQWTRSTSNTANGQKLGRDDGTFLSRGVKRLIEAVEQDEGDGASVRRSIGTYKVKNFDPFLVFDHFRISAGAGFPNHPHRGQETVTYVLQGNIDHEDFTGASGSIGQGDLQFMSVGRGIMHAEMPPAHCTTRSVRDIWN